MKTWMGIESKPLKMQLLEKVPGRREGLKKKKREKLGKGANR